MAAYKVELETGGSVWKVLAKAGDDVTEGQELFILEVMKMEVPYTAPATGKVSAVKISEGEVVEEGQIAVEIEA